MKVSVKGIAATQKRIAGFEGAIEKEVIKKIKEETHLTATLAQTKAPGRVKGLIQTEIENGGLKGSVVVRDSPTEPRWMGAYREFGTRPYVSVPQGYEEMAARFMGAQPPKVPILPTPYLIPYYEISKEEIIRFFKALKIKA